MSKERLIETIQILIIWLPFWICYKREYDTYGLFGMVIISLLFYYYGLKNEKYKLNVNLVIFIHMFSILLYFNIL
jgi:hypothetical protein